MKKLLNYKLFWTAGAALACQFAGNVAVLAQAAGAGAAGVGAAGSASAQGSTGQSPSGASSTAGAGPAGNVGGINAGQSNAANTQASGVTSNGSNGSANTTVGAPESSAMSQEPGGAAPRPLPCRARGARTGRRREIFCRPGS